MNLNSRYLIDANVFIQAKNFHYRFEFCQGFWQWLNEAHYAGLVFSIDTVRQEINDGDKDDPVRLWADALPESFFIADKHDTTVMQAYRQVMQWNVSDNHYRQQAKDAGNAFHVISILIYDLLSQYATGNFSLSLYRQ